MEKWRMQATREDAVNAGLTEKEFGHIRELLGRELSVLETGIFSALYSEHCSYKSSKLHLKTLPSEGERVVQGPGENAGVVDIGDGEVVVFKVESHNHPSFIEPYQGAATGVGGILRDVFTMGARPVANMNSLRFGTPENSRTKYLLSRCVAGIGGYGNCVGVPTVGGELFFHEAYEGNCLVNAFALGIAKKEKIFLGRAAGIGNVVIYAGSKTGRDGIHGATMASEVFSDDSDAKRPTVQVGDPFQEKLLIEACLEIMDKNLVVGIQDMGAAGMTSSSYEMADRAGTGLSLHLDRIPHREKDLNPYEIMLSESQERMLLVAEPEKADEIINIFKRWELDAVVIGEVVDGGNVDLYWHNEIVSSMPAALLTRSVPQYRWPEEKPADLDLRSAPLASIPEPEDLSGAWSRFLASINVCSRQQVYQQYDSTIRSNTVIHPGGDAAVIRVKREQGRAAHSRPEKGIAMTLDCNSRFCAVDPRQGAALAVAEACRNIAAVGATPIGISDCLNYGSPERPDSMWQIAEGIRGLGEAARAFAVPVVSGNVSLYNESKGKAILPTPLVAMVGLIEDVSKCVGINFKDDGDRVLVLGETRVEELGASEFLAFESTMERGPLPLLSYDLEIKTANLVRTLVHEGLIKSCHDVSAGGLAVALAECCFTPYAYKAVSVAEERKTAENKNSSALKGGAAYNVGLMFAESGARYVVSCRPENEEALRQLAAEKGIAITLAGEVGGRNIEIKGVASIDAAEAHKAWKSGLSGLLG